MKTGWQSRVGAWRCFIRAAATIPRVKSSIKPAQVSPESPQSREQQAGSSGSLGSNLCCWEYIFFREIFFFILFLLSNVFLRFVDGVVCLSICDLEAFFFFTIYFALWLDFFSQHFLQFIFCSFFFLYLLTFLVCVCLFVKGDLLVCFFVFISVYFVLGFEYPFFSIIPAVSLLQNVCWRLLTSFNVGLFVKVDLLVFSFSFISVYFSIHSNLLVFC